MPLSRRVERRLAAEMSRISPGGDDLYKALHHVGDDPVKAEIQEVLRDALDPAAYLTVVAVFNLATGWRDL